MKTIPLRQLTDKEVTRFESKVTRGGLDDCWLWQGKPTTNGYGTFYIAPNAYGSHRVAWFLAIGRDPGELHVLHDCDNRMCCNPAHLFLGTNDDNIKDKVAKGRAQRIAGTEHVLAKLNDAIIIDILTSPESQRAIAKRYNISRALVFNIRHRTTWKHIQCPEPIPQ